jgi:hydrogenase-4 component B
MRTDPYPLLAAAMAVYLASALLVPIVARHRRVAGWLNLVTTGLAGALLLTVGFTVLFQDASAKAALLELGPVNSHFLVDGLSGFFLILIAFMGIAGALYSIQYMEHYVDYGLRGYYAAFPLFLLGMAAVVTVDDLSLGFTLAWQIMTLSSFYLVRFEFRKQGTARAALRYLVLMQAAWAAVAGGVALIARTPVGAPLHDITAAIAEGTPLAVGLLYALLLLGFGMKAGVFPLGQLWLPDAHSIAPSPISALLSGVMIKTGIYGLLRTFFWMVPEGRADLFHGGLWGGAIAALGVATLFIGTVQSMKQSDAKRLLAYSSIGQVGYIVFGIGAALLLFHGGNDASRFLALLMMVGLTYHILNHAVFKGLLFLSSGSVLYATGTQDLNRLGGLIKLMPVTAVFAGVASLSIAGVPPFSGFASKWTLVSTSLLAGQEFLFLVLAGVIALFTSTITLACYVKFFGMTFTSAGSEWNVAHPVREVPSAMLVPKVVLGLLCLLQGFIPAIYYQTFIGIYRNSEGSSVHGAFVGTPFEQFIQAPALGVRVFLPDGTEAAYGSIPLIVLSVLGLGVLLAWGLRRSAGARSREVPTWLCGYQDLNNNNRYIDRNLFAAVKSALRWTGGNVKT